MSQQVTQRFSDRVENYIKYRPGYPAQVVKWLAETIGFKADWRIADIGSGTGISTELFLKQGNSVAAIEPNTPMREAAEKLLASYSAFESVNGTAESTTLNDCSIDLIVAGQAFHWFNREEAKAEFKRILKPGGYCLLMWNNRLTEIDAFHKSYEQILLEHSPDYAKVNHANIQEEELRTFLGDGMISHKLSNQQEFDRQGLLGRVLSSSYVPKSGDAHQVIIDAMNHLFDQHQQAGKVCFKYNCELYLGQLL